MSEDYPEWKNIDEPETQNRHILEREYDVARTRLENQQETLNALGDNATRMLRVVLLLVAGVITGVLSSGGDLTVFTIRYGLTLSTLSLLFIGAFFLVSGSLGVGTTIEHLSEIDELDDSVEEEDTSYLQSRVTTSRKQVIYNEGLIRGNRNIMELADAAVSLAIGFGTLFMIDLLIDSVWDTLFVSILLYWVLLVMVWKVDDEFPCDHPAKIFVEDKPWRLVIFVFHLVIAIAIGIEELIPWLSSPVF